VYLHQDCLQDFSICICEKHLSKFPLEIGIVNNNAKQKQPGAVKKGTPSKVESRVLPGT